MRVLITGVNGFVGSHAAEFLHQVPGVELFGTVFTEDRSQPAGPIPDDRMRRLDVTHDADVAALVDDVRPDRIIHLAGQAFVPDSVHDPSATFRANILGGISFLEAVRTHQEQTGHTVSLLVISTGDVYGRVPVEQQPITEDIPLNPANPYAASKAAIDIIAQQYRRSFGLNVHVARPFNHIGPRQSPVFVCSDFARQVAEIRVGRREPVMRVGNIGSMRDFTDVRDVVRAYWMLLEAHPEQCVFNVCSGTPVRIADILDLLVRMSGAAVTVTTDPHRLRHYDTPVVAGSHERLTRATGWVPRIPLEETVRTVLSYWTDRVNAS